MKTYLQEYRPFFVFLIKFFLVYIGLTVIYRLYLNQFDSLILFQVDDFTQLVANQVNEILSFFNYNTSLELHNNEPSVKLFLDAIYIARVVEGCNALSVMILFVAFVIALPNTIYQTWQFIAPGLYKRERRLLAGVVIFGLILFFLGIIFCYFIVLPTIFNFISRIKASDIEMFTDISKYLDLVLNLFLVFGISFQLPILIFLLINFNIITHHKLSRLRKYVLVGVFILAAIITPPDVLSQTLLAIPLYILYEIGMFAGKIFSRSYTLI